MRSCVPAVLVSTLLAAAGLQAQSLAEHAAAAAGATIGTAAGKPLSNAISTIFGKTDTAANKAATAPSVSKSSTPVTPATPSVALPAVQGGPGGGDAPSGSSAPSRHGGFPHHAAIARNPGVASTALPEILAPEPPRKEPTAEDFAAVQVGASEQDLLSALGQPESKVTIPDDDGHLIEICQYWAGGQNLGTVRLDNGLVVNVQARTRN